MDVSSLVSRLARRLRRIHGNRGSFTIDLRGVFVQAASFEEDFLLVELPGDKFLPPHHQLSSNDHDALKRLGFHAPDATSPNWWLPVEEVHEESLALAARAAISGLLEVLHVDEELLAAALSADRGKDREPREPAVETTAPEVDSPRDEEPQLRAQAEEGESLVADNPENVRLPRQLVPSREDQRALNLRLAVAEHYALTCIATGTLYHDSLAEAARELEQEHGNDAEVAGWDLADRLVAAGAAVRAFFWIRSADNNREQASDEADTWRAIQQWVRISPWSGDYDFELVPSPRQSFALAGAEVQIRRVQRPE